MFDVELSGQTYFSTVVLAALCVDITMKSRADDASKSVSDLFPPLLYAAYDARIDFSNSYSLEVRVAVVGRVMPLVFLMIIIFRVSDTIGIGQVD